MCRYVRVGSFHGVMECQVEREFLAIQNSPAMNAGGGAHGVGRTTRGDWASVQLRRDCFAL